MMRAKRKAHSRGLGMACIIGLVTLFAACTDGAYGPDTGYVDGIGPDDRLALVTPIEMLVRQTIKTNSGAIAVADPAIDVLISPQLRADLSRQGYAVAGKDEAAAHRLGYTIAPIDNRILLRVFLDNQDAAQLYQRDTAGHLQPIGPLTVRAGSA